MTIVQKRIQLSAVAFPPSMTTICRFHRRRLGFALFHSLTSAVAAIALTLTEGKCAEVVLAMTVKTRNRHALVSLSAQTRPLRHLFFQWNGK